MLQPNTVVLNKNILIEEMSQQCRPMTCFFFYQQKFCINKKERDVLKFCLYLQENLHDNFIEFKINFDLFLFKVV